MPDIVGRLKTPRLAVAPSSPTVGEMYYDTVKNQLLWWNGTIWVVSSDVIKVYEQPNAPTEPTTVGDIWVDTDGSPVLGPVGPQGPAGATGPQGPQGPTGAAGVPSSIVDVKGDLLAASANDTLVRLPAGANGTVLLADSSQSAGLKWGPIGIDLIYNGAYAAPLNANYDFETDLSGWSVSGNTTLARIITDFYSGSACMQITHTGAGGGANCLGLSYTGSLPKIPYTTAIRVKGVGSTIGKTVTLQSNETGGSQPGAGMLFGSIVLTSSWQVVQATGTPVQSDRAGTNILLGLNSGVSGDVWLVDTAGIMPLNHMYSDGDIVIGSDGGTYMGVRPTIAPPKPWTSSIADPNITDWVPLEYGPPSQLHRLGVYSARPAANAVFPGTTYFATDALGTWISDGTQWILIDQRPAFGAASILNSAPWTTPYDGMEVLLTDSFSNPAYMWYFRYNSASGSTYKWEFVGGTEYIGFSAANQQIAVVNTWTNIVASTLLPPRNGEYIMKSAVQVSHPTAGATCYTDFWAGSLPGGIFGPAGAVGFPVAGGYSLINVMGPYKAALAGGVGVGVAAQNNIANGNFSNIQWSMIPTRIS